MTKRYIIDRFTDRGFAVLEGEDGGLDLPRDLLPPGAREGDVLTVEGDLTHGEPDIAIAIDKEATAQRRATLRDKRNRLRRGPSGDLKL